MLKDLYKDERGLASVEYTLLLAVLIAAVIVTWNTFGCNLRVAIWKSSKAFDKVVATAQQ